MKKFVSILLCLVMVLGLLPMAAFAETTANVTVTPNKATPKEGEEVVFTVAADAVTAMGAAQVYVKVPAGLTIKDAKASDALAADFKQSEITILDDIVGYLLGNGPAAGFTATGSTTLFTITCTVDAGVHGSKVLEVLSTDDCYTELSGADAASWATTATVTPINVPKTAYVTPYTLTVSYDALAITDATEKTVAPTFSAKDAENDTIALDEKATVAYAFKGTAPAGLSINAETGAVTVSDAAKVVTGTVTVTATLTATGKTGTQDATITVTKADPAVTTVDPAADNKTTALIPTGDTPNTYTYKVDVKDQYGAAMDVAATWTAGTLPTGVTFDAATATLTVAKDAESGEVTLTAAVGGKSKEIKVNVTNIAFTGVNDGVKATAGTYGDKLSDMVKIDVSKLKAEAGGTVAGDYTLVAADSVPNAGEASYQVTFTSKDGAYKDVEVTNGTVTVAKKEVTVTVSDVTVKIGSDMPELTDEKEFNWTASKMVGDDKVTGTASYEFYLLDDDGEPAGTATPYASINSDEAAEYAIVVTDLSVTGNYELVVAPGTLTIRKKNLSSAPIGQGTQPVQTPDDNQGGETKGTFVDVTSGDWFYDAVEFVAAKKLFNGTSATTFSPNTNMTRAMVATVLYRLDGENKTDVAAAFEDVAADTWYSDGVAWAAEKGVVTGYSETVFAPDDNVTREQLAAMLYRYMGEPEVDAEMGMAGFNDVDAISSWAANAMRWAVQTGIINGKNGGMLDPAGNATRAEVATMLQRFVEKVAK